MRKHSGGWEDADCQLCASRQCLSPVCNSFRRITGGEKSKVPENRRPQPRPHSNIEAACPTPPNTRPSSRASNGAEIRVVRRTTASRTTSLLLHQCAPGRCLVYQNSKTGRGHATRAHVRNEALRIELVDRSFYHDTQPFALPMVRNFPSKRMDRLLGKKCTKSLL